MAFQVKQRGKITYYYEGDEPVLSALVTEELPDGDLKIHFAGLTGGYSASGVLGLDNVAHMDPEIEVPLVFECWEKWLQDAGICRSLADVDFTEIHAFGCQPKSPNPLLDPQGFADEQQRLYTAYRTAYAKVFRDKCPDNGVPARFTVHVVDVPDKAASYEFYGTALYQRSDKEDPKVASAQALTGAMQEAMGEERQQTSGVEYLTTLIEQESASESGQPTRQAAQASVEVLKQLLQQVRQDDEMRQALIDFLQSE